MFSTISSLSAMSSKVASLLSFGNVWVKRTDPTVNTYTSGNLYNNGFIDSIRTSYDGQYILVSAEANKKILRSSNYGVSWSNITSTQIPSLATQGARGCAISSTGQYMYVGSASGPVSRSSDYGVTWSSLGTGNFNCQGIDCNTDGTQIIFNKMGNSVWRGSNYGNTLTQISTAVLPTTVQSKTYNVAMSPDGSKLVVLANTWSNAVTTNVGVWISSNDATSFTNVWTGSTTMYLSDCFISNAGDFCCTAGYAISTVYHMYKASTQTWSTVNLSLGATQATTYSGGCSHDGQVMMVAVRLTNYNYIYFSTDGGTTWKRADSLGQSTYQATAVSPDGNMFLCSGITTRGDLYIST